MTKIDITEFRKDRTHMLMDAFIEHADRAKSLTCAGYKFEQVHEAQLLAAAVIHDLDEEGLLDVAQEEYPWEVERLKDYLEIYNEYSNGGKP